MRDRSASRSRGWGPAPRGCPTLPRCTRRMSCSASGRSCCTGGASCSTTGREALAAVISSGSAIGRWRPPAAPSAAAGSRSAACSAPSRGPSAAGATRCCSSRVSPTAAQRCTTASIRTTSSWSWRRCTSGRWPGMSGWYAYLKSPEQLHPDESLHRFGVSALTAQPFGKDGRWASALIWGANDPLGSGRLSNSFVLESSLDLDGMNSIFGRAEYVRKSAEDLFVPAAPAGATYDVGALALGYVRTMGTIGGLAAGVGVRGSVNFVPSSLEAGYGGRTPVGLVVYVRLRPVGAH